MSPNNLKFYILTLREWKSTMSVFTPPLATKVVPDDHTIFKSNVKCEWCIMVEVILFAQAKSDSVDYRNVVFKSEEISMKKV